MLSDKDIQKLLVVLETRFATKQELVKLEDRLIKRFEKSEDRLNKRFDTLMGAIDSYSKKADTYFQEMVALSHKMDLHEKWIRQIAEKIGVELKYQ